MQPKIGASYIDCSRAVIFEKPDKKSERVTDLPYGSLLSSVTSTEGVGGWVEIEAGTCSGWVKKRHIKKVCKGSKEESILGRIRMVWAHVYKRNSAGKPYVAFKIPYGAHLFVPKKDHTFTDPAGSGRFVKVNLWDGSVGAVREAAIDLSEKPLTVDKALEESKIFSVLPYVWGGASTIDGFDCSGFVQTLYKQMGVDIPRNSKEQYEDAKATFVKKEDIVKGDLLFFKKLGTSSIDHVGIAIDSLRFIHFTGASGRTESSLDDKEWNASFVGAKRYMSTT